MACILQPNTDTVHYGRPLRSHDGEVNLSRWTNRIGAREVSIAAAKRR